MISEDHYILPKYKDAVDKSTPRYIGRIPKVIMQTNKTHNVSKRMYGYIMELINLNPDMSYAHFSDEDIIDFIRKEYDEEHVITFKRINPGAFKADFFRLLYLYKCGGIYCDSDVEMKMPFSKVIKNFDKLIVFLDGDYNHKGCWNAIMASPPGHEVLKMNIEFHLDFVKNYVDEKIHPLSFGPGSLYKLISKYLDRSPLTAGIYRDVVIYEGLSHSSTAKTAFVGAVSLGRLKIIADKTPIGYSSYAYYAIEKIKRGMADLTSAYDMACLSGKVVKPLSAVLPVGFQEDSTESEEDNENDCEEDEKES